MRIILRIALVLIIILFLYLTIGSITLLKKTRDASERIITAIMLVGTDNEKSYLPEVSLIPPATFLSNLKIIAREGFISGFKWYDIKLESGTIELNFTDVFSNKPPRIKSIKGFNFTGKIPFDGLSRMLEKRNSSWSEIKVGRLGDEGDTIYIYAKNAQTQQSVNLIGKLIVNKDGYILFFPADDNYYDSDGNLNIKAFNEARKGMELRWSFEIFDIFIPINRVAVSEAGLYIEAGEIMPGGISDPNQPKT